MDTFTFISNLIGQVLSWPVALVVLAFLFRKPIADRIKDVRKIKTKYFEADFGKSLQKVEAEMASVEAQITYQAPPIEVEIEALPQSQEEYLARLTELMPNAAIMQSWRNVERTLDLYFNRRGIQRPESGQTVLGHLDYDPNFPPQLVSAYQELRLLRNRAAHSGENVSTSQAHVFSVLADRLTLALVNASESGEGN